MGRPAKSPEAHALAGTDPHKTTVAHVSDVPPGVPKFNRLPRDERKVAKRICGWLHRREHLTEADFELIALYAAADVRYHKFKEQLDVEGWFVQMPDGTADHPAVRHFHKAEATMLACLRDLGLTPAARDRIKRTKDKAAEQPVDPMEELLNRGRSVAVPFVVPPPEVGDEDFAGN